ncbi:MAG: protein translocase subunit SecD, partial [Alteraurantiacibacter sp.]|nr:protein translocase subunit SecD [Alteraurantiacibacter sp.]
MLDFPLWKKNFLWAVTLILVLAALPSLASLANLRWPASLPNPTVSLGLDLAGGSHILLEADQAQVARQRLENMEEAVRGALSNASPAIAYSDVSTSDGRLSITLDDPAQVDAAREAVMPLVNG